MQAYMTSLVLLAAVALPVAAQEPQCQNANPQAQAACNTMVDATKAFHPLAGMIVSGGNPVLGTAGTLGGGGDPSVGVRGQGSKGARPKPGEGRRNPRPWGIRASFPGPRGDAAAGVSGGAG